MGRGPGRIQRAVRAAIESAVDDAGAPRWVRVDEALPATATAKQHQAARQAMRTLAAAGIVELAEVRRRGRGVLAARRVPNPGHLHDRVIAAQEDVNALRSA